MARVGGGDMRRRNTTEGFVLVMVLSMAVLIAVILTVASTFAIASRQTVTAEAQKIPAFYAANAGLERAMAKLQSLLQPGRTLLNSTTLYKDSTVDLVAADLATRLGSVDNLVSTSGSVAGGTFRVTATPRSGGTVELRSEGAGTTGGKRSIILAYVINQSTLKATAGGALTATGPATISGNSPVQGTTGAVATTGFTVACTVSSGTTCTSQSAPAIYQITVPNTGQPLPNVNDNVTYLPDPVNDPSYAMGDALYKVTKVDPVTRAVELTAINETVKVTTGNGSNKKTVDKVVSLTNGARLATTTEVAAVLTYKEAATSNGSTTSTSCDVYTCGYLSTDPTKLFEATFGVTKTQFKTDLHDPLYDAHRFLTNDECSTVPGGSTVQWLTPTVNASGTVNLVNCTASRILIIDAPQVTNGLTINLNNGVFKGLLYVIGNNQKINISGNAGSFDGAVIVETGTDAQGNPMFTLSGTAKSNVCPPGATSVAAKICYDPAVLSDLLGIIQTNLDTSALPTLRDLANSWKETRAN